MRPPSLRRALLVLSALALPAAAPAQAPGELYPGPSVDLSHGPLRVSPDHRHLLHADGTPFFWLGDTAWELFHRLDREEAEVYLEDRRSKGFTVIQAVVLAEFDGLTEPNAYGETPLVDLDPARPNERYFQHVDHVVELARRKGLYVGMLPTWGDKFNKQWGVGPEIFTPENARAYGEFLGRRYRDAPIVWILGGDRVPETPEHFAIIRALAAGLEAGDGGAHLMTYHPMGGKSSAEYFHGDAWLDLDMYQSSHGGFDIANDRFVEEQYALDPPKPVLDGEPRYEDHPVNWDPKNGWFDAADVRQAAYWALLAGAAGHTYGDHNVWQMLSAEHPAVSSARTPWRQAIDQPGARQMGLVRRLFTSRPFLRLRPDQAMLVDGPGAGAGRLRAARADDGSYAIAYSPIGRVINLRLDGLRGDRLRAYWYDPRTGATTPLGTFARSATRAFDPPGVPARGNDWVLVVDDDAAGYGVPGAASRGAP